MNHSYLSGLFLSFVLLPTTVYSQTNTFPSSGNVGIGTTSPSYKLQVDLPSTSNGNDIVSYFNRTNGSTGGSSILRLNSGTSIGDFEMNSGYQSVGIRFGSYFDLNIVNNTTGGSWGAINYITNSQVRLKITPSGNVGIGTTDPGTSSLKIYKDTYPEIILADNKGSIGIQLAQNVGDNATWAQPGDATIRKWGSSHNINLVINDTYNDGNGYIKLGDNYNGAVLSVFNNAKAVINGKLGIGTSSPADKLTVRGGIAKETTSGVDGTFDNILKFGYYGDLESGGATANRWMGIDGTLTAGAAENNKMKFRLYHGTGDNASPIDVMTLNGAGNVAIGTADPGSYKLNVWGRIRAHEVVVNTTGADFVFAPDYKLLSLSEVEKFINANKHLPDFQPAIEMKENGMNVSEMQTKLLQKIEELTIYAIEQNKKIELLEKEISKLKNE